MSDLLPMPHSPIFGAPNIYELIRDQLELSMFFIRFFHFEHLEYLYFEIKYYLSA